VDKPGTLFPSQNARVRGTVFDVLIGVHCIERVTLDASSASGLLASVAKCFGIDRLVTAMVAISWKQPHAGLLP